MAVKYQPSGWAEVTSSDKSTTKNIAPKEEELIASPSDVSSVSLRLGYTHNLGNYESLRLDVGCTIPCDNNDDARNLAFSKAEKFCDDHMVELQNQVLNQNEGD